VSATRTDFHHGRHAGLLLPLFSTPTRRSWGIGEFGDLPALCSWLGEAGLDFVQVLPLNEMTAGQHSPYAAVSAMALDPIFISLWGVEDFAALGGEQWLVPADRDRLAAVRASARIDYNGVRELKMVALRAAFARFVDAEWRHDSPRARSLRDFVERERWWLEDYVLFRAEREHREEQAWWTWPAGLAARNAFALAWIRDTRREECAHVVQSYETDGLLVDLEALAARIALRPWFSKQRAQGAPEAERRRDRNEGEITVSLRNLIGRLRDRDGALLSLTVDGDIKAPEAISVEDVEAAAAALLP